tara:strand:- start:1885 stop:2127 length:243 start_codon:yes stop_codon:yes gene_type:complete
MTKAKRLEELRLSDTNYYDHDDMHLYDSDSLLYGHDGSFTGLLFSYMGVLLGLCHDYSRHSLIIPILKRLHSDSIGVFKR